MSRPRQSRKAKRRAAAQEIHLHINRRELATLLAALRFHQAENLQGRQAMADQRIADIASDGGRIRPLEETEVDALCQKLNTAPAGGLYINPPDREAGPVPLFRVVYRIDMNGASPLAAARSTYRIMVDPQAMPPVLEVIDPHGRVTTHDLEQLPTHR